jgi:hypothetical protein
VFWKEEEISWSSVSEGGRDKLEQFFGRRQDKLEQRFGRRTR